MQAKPLLFKLSYNPALILLDSHTAYTTHLTIDKILVDLGSSTIILTSSARGEHVSCIPNPEALLQNDNWILLSLYCAPAAFLKLLNAEPHKLIGQLLGAFHTDEKRKFRKERNVSTSYWLWNRIGILIYTLKALEPTRLFTTWTLPKYRLIKHTQNPSGIANGPELVSFGEVRYFFIDWRILSESRQRD